MEDAVNSPGEHSACDIAREALLDQLDRSGQAIVPLEAFHCGACQAWFERALSHSDALARLPRASSGPELDGRVVAELHAGCRQERAGLALAALAPLRAPAELDQWVAVALRTESPIRHRAPEQLEERVASELVSPGSERIARQLASLQRFSSPGDLEQRVIRVLARAPRSDSLPIRRWVAIAATLLVVFGAGSLIERAGQPSPPTYSFRVVHVESTASLDPFARGLLAASSGGVLGLPTPSSDGNSGEQR
jgi:hypothetical protein